MVITVNIRHIYDIFVHTAVPIVLYTVDKSLQSELCCNHVAARTHKLEVNGVPSIASVLCAHTRGRGNQAVIDSAMYLLKINSPVTTRDTLVSVILRYSFSQ